jgi:hypothetical protein
MNLKRRGNDVSHNAAKTLKLPQAIRPREKAHFGQDSDAWMGAEWLASRFEP